MVAKLRRLIFKNHNGRTYRVQDSNNLCRGCEDEFCEVELACADDSKNAHLNKTEEVCAGCHAKKSRVHLHNWSLHIQKADSESTITEHDSRC
jgi:hypothetical protein